MTTHTEFDVVIIGAGPAGCGIASALAVAGTSRIALVEKPVTPPFRIGESATPDVPRLLEQLGLDFDIHEHRPYTRNLVSWGTAQAETHDFLFRGKGNGWHLNRAAFDERLKQSVMARGIPVFSPDRLETPEPCMTEGWPHPGWELHLHSGKTIRTRVVVDASGRSAAFAQRLGITRTRLDALVALACRVPDAGNLQGASFVNTCRYGWWYAVNLGDGFSLVSLMTDAHLAKSLNLYETDTFRQAWQENEQLSHHIPAPEQLQRPHAFAAHTSYLQQAAGKNWLAVGDALLSFDPLTSSGISGALTDAVAALPVVQAQLAGDFQPARNYALRANTTLKRYLAQRAEHYARETRWPDEPFWKARQTQTWQQAHAPSLSMNG